jgi:CRISPR-associated endoribonuclease Cas6
MPHSLVFNLLPQSSIPSSHLSGQHLHALFLDLVRSVDADLAANLHQQTAEKAFTLSPLQVLGSAKCEMPTAKFTAENKDLTSKISYPKPHTQALQFQHNRSIPAGTPCWWRISLLDESLFSQLTYLWLSLNANQSWHLGPAELQVVSILGTPQSSQPWANFATYTQLYEQASESDRQIHLQFCTPTTFRQNRYDCAMPTQNLVFHSLLKRWNHYSNLPFPKTLIDCIYPSYFEIRTEIVRDSRSKFIGCMGTVTFQILGDIDCQTIRQINVLADFALYSGVGRKTPMGMGMVRRISTTSPHCKSLES